MKIHCVPVDGEAYRINLAGRMDLPGTEAIETELATLTGPPKTRILLDLSGVNFITSYGIRVLLYNAKGMHRRGGRLVLVSPDSNVAKILETAGIGALIPMCASVEEAMAQLERGSSPSDEDN